VQSIDVSVCLLTTVIDGHEGARPGPWFDATRPDSPRIVGKTMRRNALEESRLLEATSCEDVSEVLDLRVR
jgi:hypothetical protein